MDKINNTPQPEIKTIFELPFEQLTIPSFQRPYKWSAKNVNELISDIVTFKNNSQYRLGTLVLYNNGTTFEIVDGQQRIVTIVLIIKILYNKIKVENKEKLYQTFTDKMNSFLTNTRFSNIYSLHNIVENIRTIEERSSNIEVDIFDFILKKCEFVVITLNDISEAFQFFDSQNSRGKDLEAHDLLKAYHLREITELTTVDSDNIDKWQKQDTEYLKEIFLFLYRAKRWSQGKSAREFTKNDTYIFKGISISDGKRYPFYQLEIIAHIFTQMYSRDATRWIDQNTLQYPFNLDDQIVNGSRFFDMIRYYIELYESVSAIVSYCQKEQTREILECIKRHDGSYRIGDQYVKDLFETALLYYVDRFGMEELDMIIPKFFVWAYRIRLENKAVQLSTIDNYAIAEDSLIRQVHDSQTPFDIINKSISINADKKENDLCSKCGEIFIQFEKLNKKYNNHNYGDQ